MPASRKTADAVVVRKATRNETRTVWALDRNPDRRSERRRMIADAVRRGDCYVARSDGHIVGFALLDRSFFREAFVSLLLVHPEHRRRGIGSSLMRAVEGSCRGGKLFTSTNESNFAMQRLCRALGYVRSGRVENLDDGDPELIYFKRLPGKGRSGGP